MKLKVKTKSCQLYVKVRFSLDEVINTREMDLLLRNHMSGFLKPKQLRKRNVIEYSGPVGVNLYEHFSKPLSKYEFFYIITQIVEITRKIERNNLFLNNLILDLRYVFINETTKEVQFIYLPLVSNHFCVDLIGFIESLIYSIKSNGNSDYIVKFMNFIKSVHIFDQDEIEQYISTEDKNIVNQIKNRRIGQSGFITDKPIDYYDHYEKKDLEVTSLLDETATSKLNEDDELTSLLGEENTTLLDEESETMDLSKASSYYRNIHFASLYRKTTDEIISLNKPVFRIGKEKSYVDYFVTNNNGISRGHADIITRGNRYFIYDHNSTNHSYINELLVPIKQEIEIFDGNVLMLGNEEFLFHI